MGTFISKLTVLILLCISVKSEHDVLVETPCPIYVYVCMYVCMYVCKHVSM